MLLPNFAADFEQIAKFDAATNGFKHYVGNPKFNDFDSLEYGEGYQFYCKASSPVTVSLKGRLPTRRLSKSLAAGWHLLGSTTLADTPVATWLAGVSYAEVKEYASGDSPLATATQAKPGKAYWVNVSASSTWTPPVPRDVTTRFVYDGDGGRVKQVTAAGTTTYLGEAYEKSSTGQTTKSVFAGSQRIATKDSTGALRFYHGDHLGSSNVITDGTGALVELAEYTPYGSLSRREGPMNVPQKFTGQRLDASTGLYFYNARYYDPSLGRFVSPDVIVQAPTDPQTLNRYSYVRNNPVRFVDPSGHFIFAIFAAIIAAIKVVVSAVVSFAIAHPIWFGAIAGGLSNVAANASQITSFSGFVKSALVGAASGAIGAWTGIGAFGVLKGPLGAFGGGLVSAGAGGLTGGFVSGTGNALAAGASFKQAVTVGVQAAVMSAAISSVLFVAGYGVARTIQAVKDARATQQAGGTKTSAARGQPTKSRIVVGPLEAPDGTPLEPGPPGFRYVGPEEAAKIRDTGFVPNTNIRGDPKSVFFTYDDPTNSAGQAQQIYGLEKPPTHRAAVDLSKVRIDYSSGFEAGGTIATEGTTSSSIPAIGGVTELGP